MHRIPKLVAIALAAACVVGIPAHAELSAARARRTACGFGTNATLHVVHESLSLLADGMVPHDEAQVASATGGLISDHDLFMLVEGARFWIGRDEDLASALEGGRLPVRYAYLDGYDVDRVALRRCLAQDLPTMEAGTWATSPVLLGWPASPSLHDVAASLVDDHPLLSLHTGGQVLSGGVRARGLRYSLTCATEDPRERTRRIGAVERRVHGLVSRIEDEVGTHADDYAYTRAAFDALAQTITYAEREQGAQPHDNDVYGALVEGSARCYGLCGALKLVLDEHGIPNYIADGTKPSGRHSWSMVWVNGSWRVCDLTLRINSCLALEQNFYTAHAYVPDDECRILELVYSKLVS